MGRDELTYLICVCLFFKLEYGPVFRNQYLYLYLYLWLYLYLYLYLYLPLPPVSESCTTGCTPSTLSWLDRSSLRSAAASVSQDLSSLTGKLDGLEANPCQSF